MRRIVANKLVLVLVLMGEVILLQGALPAPAQTDGKVLTLDEAIGIALRRNPSLAAARANQRASRWDVRKAYLNLLPKVDLGQSLVRIDQGAFARASVFPAIGRGLIQFLQATNPDAVRGVDPNDIRDAYRTMWGTSLQVVQPIYNGGAEWASIGMAEARESSERWNVEATRQDVILETRKAYLNALRAREFAALARQSLEASKRHLESARRMLESGLRSRTEVLRWEVQVANDEANLIDAENRLEIARAALVNVMGLKEEATFQIADLSEEPRPIRQSVDELVRLAQRHDPGLRTAEAGVQAQRAGVRLAWSGFQPKINLFYNRAWEQNNTLALDGFSTWSASISVSLPIFHSFTEYANLKRAKETLTSAQKMKERYERGLTLRVKSAALNARSAWRRLQVHQKAVQEAEENLRVVNHLFEAGMAANIDVIDAQLAATSARANAISARYDYFLARAELERVVGVLEE